jgi:putative transposase
VEPVEAVRWQLFRTASEFEFAVLAYCFMPDHLHTLLEGQAERADFRLYMHAFKQRSAFNWKRAYGRPLWERSYFEHVLRDDESATTVARYIVDNPVRAGLIASPADYPFSGSGILKMEDLVESVRKM